MDDIKVIGTQTEYVVGMMNRVGFDGQPNSGDPSPATAWGVLTGIKAVVSHAMHRNELDGVKVAVQGLGKVGYQLARYLKDSGANVYVTDIHREIVKRAVDELGVIAVACEDFFSADVDVLAPCAMGAVLDDRTIPQLKAKIVAGSANNQLRKNRHGQALLERGIIYAPDYVINVGGIIDVSHEREHYDPGCVKQHIESIGVTLKEIFERSGRDGIPTLLEADRLAEERLHHRMVA